MLWQDKRAYHAHPSLLSPACKIPNQNIKAQLHPQMLNPTPKASLLPHSHIPKHYTPHSLYPNQALNLLPPLVPSNYYNTSPPSTALPLVPLTHVCPRQMSFPQELSQQLLDLTDQRKLALRAFTQCQQSS